MEDPFSEQRKTRSAVCLSFDQFEFGHMTFSHAVIDPPGETGSHRIFVFLDASSKGLKFGKFAAFHLGQPGIEMLSRPRAQHLGKLLHQIIGQINFWVALTELDQRLLLLDAQFWRRDEVRGRQLAVR